MHSASVKMCSYGTEQIYHYKTKSQYPDGVSEGIGDSNMEQTKRYAQCTQFNGVNCGVFCLKVITFSIR